MPHVIVKLWPGKSDAQKTRLAEEIAQSLRSVMGSGDAAISIGIEEIAPEEWTEKVYEPDIRDKWDTLLKTPGYGPRA